MSYTDRIGERTIAIFLLHGVTRQHECRVRNYTRKHLELDYFASVLRGLKAVGTAVSMEDIRRHYQFGESLPPKAFAITFDDGFQNNLTVAAPVLTEEGVPATFYVTSDFVDRNRMAWIDRIEFAVEQRESGRLYLPWGIREFCGDTQRREILSEIRMRVKSDQSMDSDGLATEIQQQLNVPVTWSSNHPLDQKLSWSEVKTLASNPLFIVAGHSHTHRILEYLSDDELERDIDRSLVLLADKAGIRSHHYSYPEGLSFCYSERVIDVLRSRGVDCCPSAVDGVNDADVDLFHLKRIMVV